MSNFLPNEYELRANYYALAMAINEDVTPDVAMTRMQVEPEKSKKGEVTNVDIASMIRMQRRDNKSLSEIAKCFNLDKEVVKQKMVRYMAKYRKKQRTL